MINRQNFQGGWGKLDEEEINFFFNCHQIFLPASQLASEIKKENSNQNVHNLGTEGNAFEKTAADQSAPKITHSKQCYPGEKVLVILSEPLEQL